MARNTGRGTRAAHAVRDAEKSNGTARTGLWAKRNPVSGYFTEAKKTGGAFKGARRAG
jgi:hypothetical protein